MEAAGPVRYAAIARSFLLFGAISVLPGCVLVWTRPYPEEWPERLRATGCAAVLGTYENEGITDEGKSGDTLFMFVGLSGRADHPGERITLSQITPQVLDVRGRDASREYRFTGGEVRCRNGALEFYRVGTDCSEGICLRGSTRTVLSRAADGALVVKWHNVATGVMGALPVHSRDTRWYRYEQVE
jgi:hypothetical protein